MLTLWNVAAGAPSSYYASIAVSMSQTWSNFLFGAMDPAGTVSLDKIPGSFWVPALVVRLFGYSAAAVIVPNALATVGAVMLVAISARRLLGDVGGLIAGTVVATTPILVAVARSNEPEAFVVLALAATLWATLRAVDTRRLRWLVLAGVFIGLGFQCYMLIAWAAWPAVAVGWVRTRQPWRRTLWTLFVAGAVSLAVSLWWVIVVALVPASVRPYVGSTRGNSSWEMVFGYNGLGRFGETSGDYLSFTPVFSGAPGVLRLLNAQLAGQIGWLVPTTIVALALLWWLRWRRTVTLVLTVWFFSYAVMFSAVAGMHQFYTAVLAMPMALAIAAAVVIAVRRRRRRAVIVLLATAAATALGMGLVAGGWTLVLTVLQALCGVAAIVLWRRGAVFTTLIIAALLIAPAGWSAATLTLPNATNPVAGTASGLVGEAGTGVARAVPLESTREATVPLGAVSAAKDIGITAAISSADTTWLRKHRGSADYLVATFGAQEAARAVLMTRGAWVLPIGGFNVRDAAPTFTAFRRLIADERLRYVFLNSAATGNEVSAEAVKIRTWVVENCVAVEGAPSSAIRDCAPAVAGAS